MNKQPEKTTKAVKAVSIAVCSITTAAMCASLIASHSNHPSGKTTVKLIYMGHAPKVGHA